jgi:choline dehydrogenase-like flavoprotein
MRFGFLWLGRRPPSRRDPLASVLLIEAGGSDDVPAVQDAARALGNLGSERDWAFPTRANPHLNGRALLCSMGKVVGGGSSMNFMVWYRRRALRKIPHGRERTRIREELIPVVEAVVLLTVYVPAAVEDWLANGVGPQKAFGYGAFIPTVDPREGVWI